MSRNFMGICAVMSSDGSVTIFGKRAAFIKVAAFDAAVTLAVFAAGYFCGRF
jgi:hypothetical protein